MIQLANTTDAPAPRTQIAVKVGLVYAVILIFMAVGQLYAFEKFIPLIADYWLPGGHGTATLVAGLIVITEIFALPFLLRMRISPLMRWVGAACSILVAVIWLKLALVGVFETTALTNSGMLGTKVSVHAGAAQLVVSVVLAALAAYSVYGLWPTYKK
ncbi:MAG: rane protein of unknown function [Candidatus Saccharibacteria bacterium]|nr:rane protein of unknown function [Candidatus Saccharibacteria bacterium]